jgi:hypothetical protein
MDVVLDAIFDVKRGSDESKEKKKKTKSAPKIVEPSVAISGFKEKNFIYNIFI